MAPPLVDSGWLNEILSQPWAPLTPPVAPPAAPAAAAAAVAPAVAASTALAASYAADGGTAGGSTSLTLSRGASLDGCNGCNGPSAEPLPLLAATEPGAGGRPRAVSAASQPTAERVEVGGRPRSASAMGSASQPTLGASHGLMHHVRKRVRKMFRMSLGGSRGAKRV